MQGRKPIPTEVKRLMGTGRRPLPKAGEEAEPSMLGDLPEPPDWLGPHGSHEWSRVGPMLIEQRLLTASDLLAFSAYCAAVDLMVESMQDIQKNGHVVPGQRGPVRNPALAAFTQAVTTLRQLATEFGMTPSARSRIKLPTEDDTTLASLLAEASADEDAA